MTPPTSAQRGEGGFVLDPPTLLAINPILEAGDRAIKERDEWNRWSVELAMDLGVSVGEFQSQVISEQYYELRQRISAAVRTIDPP